MAVLKLERCKCGYARQIISLPKTPRSCPRCGQELKLSENWYIRHKVQGKTIVKAIGPNKRMAEDALAKEKVAIREGTYFDKAPVTSWHTAVKSFKKHVETTCRPKTKAMYENSLKALEPYFKDMTLNKITPHMVEEFKQERSKAIANSSVNRDIATIKRLFSLAEDWNMVNKNQLRKIKMLKESGPRTRALTEKEAQKLINACGPPWLKIAVIIALETGLRKSAIFTLRRQQINLEKKLIEAESKGKNHIIPMTERLKMVLQAYLREQKIFSRDGYIFPGQGKKASGHIRIDSDKSFKTACRKAGILNFRFHDLRHTFASIFYERTRDWRALQEILGHADISTTMKIYTHLRKEHIRDAMKKFEGGAK
jgi:integrase